MVVKDFLTEQKEMIKDVKDKAFVYSSTVSVPLTTDFDLTYESGDEKKGKLLESCVLFTDIRNSVSLNKKHDIDTMGRIYTAFTKGVLNAAAYHGGMVRNIIGDRVMVVFPKSDCFKNAVYCATTINSISKLINSAFHDVEFKCGIGVDYGEMHIIKVGVEKHSDENTENKNLVWIGKPANLASRLCDVANKEFNDKVFIVRGEFYYFNPLENHKIFGARKSGYYKETRKMTEEEMIDSLKDIVYKEYSKACPNDIDVKDNFWKKQSRKIKDVESDVWGSGLKWEL